MVRCIVCIAAAATAANHHLRPFLIYESPAWTRAAGDLPAVPARMVEELSGLALI